MSTRGSSKSAPGETIRKASTPKTKKPQAVCRRLEAKPPNPKGRKMKETLHTAPDKINKRIRQAGRLLTAVQSASARRHDGSYSFSHVSDDVKLVIWSEDPIAQDETVCIVEFGAKRATFIRDANVAHFELHERLAGLVGWEICTVDGMIARAAT